MADAHEPADIGGRPRVVYRLVRRPRPTRVDFESRAARGVAPTRRGAYYAELNRGVSVVASIAHARILRDLFPRTHWEYVAKLAIPAGVRLEQSGWEGHYTVWAPPEDLLSWVVGVEPLGLK